MHPSARIAAAFALAGLVALAAWFGAAAVLHARSFGDAPLATRAAAAKRAARLQPFRREYASRAAQLEGERLFASGRTLDAYELMHDAIDAHPGNPSLRRTFKRVEAAFIVESARKAHQQHGHEGPNGELDPEDVER